MRRSSPGSLVLPFVLIRRISAESVGAGPLNPVLGPQDLCLPWLLLAILTEGTVILICAGIRRKPTARLLLACTLANCISVMALALLITLSSHLVGSSQGYAAVLITAEIVIWLFEAYFVWRYPGTQVNWKEALSFSLATNLASLAAGYAVAIYLA